MSTRRGLKSEHETDELQKSNFEYELAITQNTNMAVYLLYKKQCSLVPKVKAAVDFLVQKIKETNEE